jgi:hypothetical protein
VTRDGVENCRSFKKKCLYLRRSPDQADASVSKIRTINHIHPRRKDGLFVIVGYAGFVRNKVSIRPNCLHWRAITVHHVTKTMAP